MAETPFKYKLVFNIVNLELQQNLCKLRHIYIYIYIIIIIITIISNLSNDRSKASSKTIPPHSAI